jgi:BirA family biotin operon repressor/biotin-[acetyl-CoA-carboxylase] ligase
MVNEPGDTHRSLILQMLRQASAPVSGEGIGTAVGISRVAVHKHIKALAGAGYVLKSTRQGYVLDEVNSQHFTSWEFLPEEQITVIPGVDSTMNAARQITERHPGSDFTLAAETQSHGRGRLHRKWESPEGGLWATRIIHPAGSAVRMQLYVMAGAAALARLLRTEGIDARLKWPNDVLVNDWKIAGVLAEARLSSDRFEYLALGMGLNINNRPLTGATALKSLTGREEDRRVWLRHWIREFHQLTASDEFQSARDPRWWTSMMWGIGRPVSFTVTGLKRVSGTVTGTDGLGRLCIRTVQGAVRRLASGDLDDSPAV